MFATLPNILRNARLFWLFAVLNASGCVCGGGHWLHVHQPAENHSARDQGYYHCPHCGQVIVKGCHHDCCASLPCYGYSPTCWHPWPADCQGCPPPSVSIPYAAQEPSPVPAAPAGPMPHPAVGPMPPTDPAPQPAPPQPPKAAPMPMPAPQPAPMPPPAPPKGAATAPQATVPSPEANPDIRPLPPVTSEESAAAEPPVAAPAPPPAQPSTAEVSPKIATSPGPSVYDPIQPPMPTAPASGTPTRPAAVKSAPLPDSASEESARIRLPVPGTGVEPARKPVEKPAAKQPQAIAPPPAADATRVAVKASTPKIATTAAAEAKSSPASKDVPAKSTAVRRPGRVEFVRVEMPRSPSSAKEESRPTGLVKLAVPTEPAGDAPTTPSEATPVVVPPERMPPEAPLPDETDAEDAHLAPLP